MWQKRCVISYVIQSNWKFESPDVNNDDIIYILMRLILHTLLVGTVLSVRRLIDDANFQHNAADNTDISRFR